MSSAEALRDLLTFLNRNEFKRPGPMTEALKCASPEDYLDEAPFYIDDNAVFASYATLRMSLIFNPIFALQSTPSGSRLSGYEAELTLAAPTLAHTTAALIAIEDLPHWIADDKEVIYLDRLARTLHTLNFLAQDATGDLHLNVHPQHLLAVHADHGRVFEQILAQCGLQPEQIVLEIAEHAIRDKQRLKVAIAAWQSRHYRIAIDDFGTQHSQLVRVLGLKPDIIKFNSCYIERQLATPSSRQRLSEQLQRLQSQNVFSIVTGIESAAQYEIAQENGFSAAQGPWLIKPGASAFSDELRQDALDSEKIFLRAV